MRTIERLKKFQEWTYKKVCKGRSMKAPAPKMDIRKVDRQEPKVFLGYTPMRHDQSNFTGEIDPLNTAPGIIIAPTGGYLKNPEEQRFDRYNKVNRPKEMGQSLSAQVLFFVYEDGIRYPGFVESAKSGEYDMSLIAEGTQEGLTTLINWMDDFTDALMAEKAIPDTDLVLNMAESTYSLYSDQKYIADRRPVFIGVVTVTFQCHADEYNDKVNELLNK